MAPNKVPPSPDGLDPEVQSALENFDKKAALRRPGEPFDAAALSTLLKATGTLPDAKVFGTGEFWRDPVEKDPTPADVTPPTLVSVADLRGKPFDGPRLREFLTDHPIRLSEDLLSTPDLERVDLADDWQFEKLAQSVVSGRPETILGDLDDALFRLQPRLPLEGARLFWTSRQVWNLLSQYLGVPALSGVRRVLSDYAQVLSALAAPSDSQPAPIGLTPFTVPPSTEWKDIEIFLLVGGLSAQISVKDQPQQVRAYTELGFGDGRNKKSPVPIDAWETLQKMARAGGRLDIPTFKESLGGGQTARKLTEEEASRKRQSQQSALAGERTRLETEIGRIRKIFRQLFPGINGDPLPIEGPRKSRCYSAKFKFRSDSFRSDSSDSL